MRALALSLVLAIAATPVLAAEGPYSAASEESAEGIAALAEAGVKTVAGVVALPLMLGAGGSAAVGSTASNFGEASLEVAEGASDAALEAAEFATSPLTVTDPVVLRPQPAPRVPAQARPQ